VQCCTGPGATRAPGPDTACILSPCAACSWTGSRPPLPLLLLSPALPLLPVPVAAVGPQGTEGGKVEVVLSIYNIRNPATWRRAGGKADFQG
jgi:hypothetical protein